MMAALTSCTIIATVLFMICIFLGLALMIKEDSNGAAKHSKEKQPPTIPRPEVRPQAEPIPIPFAQLGFEPSKEQIDNMRHATAWPKNYRNHFCASLGSVLEWSWGELCLMGYATRGREVDWLPYAIYHVSPEGLKFLETLAEKEK